jgi:hypothetical protein
MQINASQLFRHLLEIHSRLPVAVAHDEAGFLLLNKPRPGAMVGAAPVLVVLATAVMAASDRPYVALLKLSPRPRAAQVSQLPYCLPRP